MPFLLRSVERVEVQLTRVDLWVRAVEYFPLMVAPGILTTESAEAQGLERRLPHLPELGSSEPASQVAILRISFVDPATARITLMAVGDGYGRDGQAWSNVQVDALADGILVGAPLELQLAASETSDQVRIGALDGLAEVIVERKPFGLVINGSQGEKVLATGGDRRQVAGLPLAAAFSFDRADDICGSRPSPGGGQDADLDARQSAGFSFVGGKSERAVASTVAVALELAADEVIVGFGEQHGPFSKNGQRLELATDDALGSGTGRAYKAAPVWHSSKGWSGFLHTPGPVVADIGAAYPSLLQLQTDGAILDLFVFVGGSPKERLTRYTALTGRATVPPRWAFGLWMGRCRYRNRLEAEEAAHGMRSHKVPCDVIHIDPDWLERDMLNCDFVWSESKYPDPAGFIEKMAADGFHISLWELPYLDPDSPLYVEGESKGFLVTGASGATAAMARTFSRDSRPRGLVDFSNPSARQWWKDQHRHLLDLGVAIFKTDFGEGLPDDAAMFDGRSGRRWRNLYPLWYNRTVWEAIGEITGRAPLVWGRSGWAGSQRYPAQWGGDAESSVAGMAATLRAGLSWALSAPGLWSHDVGGFYGGSTGKGLSAELYIRWAQFGLLSGLTRFHGLSPREPWVFGDKALEIVREFAILRYRLLPYLCSLAWDASESGWPMMRPMCLEFPEDPYCWYLGHQYMLGADLMIVPVLKDSPKPAEVSFHLPPGQWFDFFEGTAFNGPSSLCFRVELDRMPVLVRAGSVIAMGPDGQHTGEIPEGEWTLHCWPGPARVTTVRDSSGLARYLPQGQDMNGVPSSVLCEEDTPRAASALAHLPSGQVRPMELRR
ncbi:MAG: hypothetical protein M1115_11600 [Actinobacteria bacterium]|nr:hypothetical protein [Actinomycetota bacterium]